MFQRVLEFLDPEHGITSKTLVDQPPLLDFNIGSPAKTFSRAGGFPQRL
jgi:hypothetical protein